MSESAQPCLRTWLVLNSIHSQVECHLTNELQRTCSLTPTEFEALVRFRSDPSGLRPGDIAVCVGLSQPAISRMINRLEQRGLVFRVADPADKRATRLTLTETGTDLCERAAAIFADSVRQALGNLLTAEQQSAILNVLGTLPGTGDDPDSVLHRHGA